METIPHMTWHDENKGQGMLQLKVTCEFSYNNHIHLKVTCEFSYNYHVL